MSILYYQKEWNSYNQGNEPPESARASEEELCKALRAYTDRKVPGTGIAQLIGRLIPQSLRPKLRIAATQMIAPWERGRAHKLAQQEEVKLNLGCGTLTLAGWINVDLVGLPVDLAWDITRPLPFKADCVDVIFHEHVLEHLDAYCGYQFLRECHRVLKPGGIMRIVMPDASRYIRSYCDPTHQFLKNWRGVPFTPLMALQEEFYNFGHRAMYDSETLVLFCQTIGFQIVETKQFGDSRITPCPDSAWRVTDSFYVEVVK